MSDEPDSLTLRLLRRIDASVSRLADDMHEVKVRLTAVEAELGNLRVMVAGTNARLDRMELRVERIEHRLELREAPQ